MTLQRADLRRHSSGSVCGLHPPEVARCRCQDPAAIDSAVGIEELPSGAPRVSCTPGRTRSVGSTYAS